MKWKKAYNYYLGSSIAMLALLAAMAGLIIYPALQKIVKIKKEIVVEKVNLEKKLEMGLNAKEIKDELQSVENQIIILDSVFIPKGKELDLLSEIESLAARNNVIVTIKPDFKGVNLGNGIARNSLNIQAQGNFKNLMSFLNGLDSAAYFLITDQISLENAGKDNLSLNIAGQIYFKTPEKK